MAGTINPTCWWPKYTQPANCGFLGIPMKTSSEQRLNNLAARKDNAGVGEGLLHLEKAANKFSSHKSLQWVASRCGNL